MAGKKAEPEKNAEKSPKPTGKNSIRPHHSPKPFTSENQPSPEAKRAGQRRYWALKELLNLPAGRAFKEGGKDYVKACAEWFGIEIEEVTVKLLMEFRQVEKAVKKSDTNAFKAIQDRAFGKPRQEGWDEVPEQPKEEGGKSAIDFGGGIIFEV